jgi:hypothetical protein
VRRPPLFRCPRGSRWRSGVRAGAPPARFLATSPKTAGEGGTAIPRGGGRCAAGEGPLPPAPSPASRAGGGELRTRSTRRLRARTPPTPPLPRSWGRGRQSLRGTSKKAGGGEGPRRAATGLPHIKKAGSRCREPAFSRSRIRRSPSRNPPRRCRAPARTARISRGSAAWRAGAGSPGTATPASPAGRRRRTTPCTWARPSPSPFR